MLTIDNIFYVKEKSGKKIILKSNSTIIGFIYLLHKNPVFEIKIVRNDMASLTTHIDTKDKNFNTKLVETIFELCETLSLQFDSTLKERLLKNVK